MNSSTSGAVKHFRSRWISVPSLTAHLVTLAGTWSRVLWTATASDAPIHRSALWDLRTMRALGLKRELPLPEKRISWVGHRGQLGPEGQASKQEAVPHPRTGARLLTTMHIRLSLLPSNSIELILQRTLWAPGVFLPRIYEIKLHRERLEHNK